MKRGKSRGENKYQKRSDIKAALSTDELKAAIETGNTKYTFNANGTLVEAIEQLKTCYEHDTSRVIRNGVAELYHKKFLVENLSNPKAMEYLSNMLKSSDIMTMINTHIFKPDCNFNYKTDSVVAFGESIGSFLERGGIFVEIISPEICASYPELWKNVLASKHSDAFHRYSIYPLKKYMPFGNFIAWETNEGKYAAMDGWGYFNPEGKKVAQLITSSDYASIFYERHREIREDKRFCGKPMTLEEAVARYS